MKRDVDLCRQLLLDIEARGADCSVSILRTGPAPEAQERVRYHLRLLIDANLLKEIDLAANGVPCVRLTDAGHELIELTRSEGRWREAKWSCQERIGGLSLQVIRSLLLRWAFEAPRVRQHDHEAPAPSALVDGRYRGRRSAYRLEPYVEQSRRQSPREDAHYVRVRPQYRHGWQVSGFVDREPAAELDFEPTIPEYLL